MNLISIIIPTFNRKKYLQEAVESCLSQSYSNIEIIIVDDGSTDGTEKTVSDLLRTNWENKNIVYIKQRNAGASVARNHGLNIAKGEFVQFLDSDDLLLPYKLEMQLSKLVEANADGCSCYGIMGEKPETAPLILGENFDSVLDLMHKICSGRVHVMQTMAPLWRKSLLLQTEGWNNKISFGDDLEYHIRVLSKANKMTFIFEKMFFLREHLGERLSVVDGSLKQIESGVLTQLSVYRNLLCENLWDKKFQNGVLKNLRSLYANYLKMGSKSEIQATENLILKVISNPTINFNFLILIYTRRVFGGALILFLFNLKKRILS